MAWASGLPAGIDVKTLPTSRSSIVLEPPDNISSAPNPGVLPPDTRPYGASYGEWGERWWRWILSIPAASNPLLGDASQFCNVQQSGPVWFLVGASGSHSCTIPSGRAIFFPIINLEVDAPCPFPECAANLTPEACAQDPAACESCLQGLASEFVASIENMSVEVDGSSLQNLFDYRGSSGLFFFAADVSLQAFDGCITGTNQPFVSDGYWIMLAPLRAGHHTLHFSGSGTFLGFPFSVDTTYDLTIVPGHRRGTEVVGTPLDSESATWGLVKQLFR